MNTNDFGKNKTGKLVKMTGLQGETIAFVPDFLPPNWQGEANLYQLLSQAKMELGRLDGIGRYLPNPLLLVRPLQRFEAQMSSELEGTIADPEQLMLFELDPKEPTSMTDEINPVQEVDNLKRALVHWTETRKDLPISLRLIKDLHRILMEGVRGRKKAPGEFRRVPVKIGADGRYIPPPPNELPGLLDNLEKFTHQDQQYDPLIRAFLAHYQFEAIHPFRDGNGRVGRLLLALMIEEQCGLAGQWLYMSPYFNRNRDMYLDRLYQVSTKGEWSAWVTFCLQGVIEQAVDAQARCEDLLNLQKDYHTHLIQADANNRIHQMVDDLFIQPFTTVPRYMEKFGISRQTALTDLDQLIRLGILEGEKIEGIRAKVYHCPEIRGITYRRSSEQKSGEDD